MLQRCNDTQGLRIVIPNSTGSTDLETLEGIVKHNGPLAERSGAAVGRYRDTAFPRESPTTSGHTIWNSGVSRRWKAQVAADRRRHSL